MLEDLSLGKILLIVLVLVIFFGPKRIPEIAQSIGKGIREFKKSMREVNTDDVDKQDDKKD
ncbi:MAG: Sec-independent protein translocase subunit TatA/TatB [Candidatus Kryptoniota bacterium]